ncbi:MAG: cytochrome ubiquinol oxidase subunit I, partial [Thermoanaerobaculia bacterium]
VYGLMKTRDGVSKVVIAPEIITSIALFAVIYSLLGTVWIFLLRREVLHGPEGEPLPEPVEAPRPRIEPAVEAPVY